MQAAMNLAGYFIGEIMEAKKRIRLAKGQTCYKLMWEYQYFLY